MELRSSFWSMADTRADMAFRMCVYCVYFSEKKHKIIPRIYWLQGTVILLMLKLK